MSEIINWSFSVRVAQGPTLAATNTKLVEAYDKIRLVLAAAIADVAVNLVPAGEKAVDLLLIKATSYVDAKDGSLVLSYKVNNNATSRNLTDPLLLIGVDAVGLLAPNLTSLTFSNPTSAEITVDILVGRDATPLPAVP